MTAQFIRSDAMTARGGAVPDRVIEADWFQLTYDALRVAPDGDTVAMYRADVDAWETTDGTAYSDVVLSA